MKEKQRKEAIREETTHSAEEGVTISIHGQTNVTHKWTQRVEERRAHLNCTSGTQRGNDKCLLNRLR